MWKVALHQMRASLGRLAAASIAIVLGTAFVAATLLVGETMQATTYRALASAYADGDLVITTDTGFDGEQVASLRSIPGIEAADPLTHIGAQVRSGELTEWASMGQAPSHERLSVAALTDGAMPVGAGEVALVQSMTQRLGVAVGDEVTLVWEIWGARDMTEVAHQVTVTGVLAEPESFFFASQQVLVDADTLAAWEQATADDGPPFWEVVAVLEPGASQADVVARIGEDFQDVSVQTVRQRAEELAALYAGDDQVFTALLLGFAAVSLAVAALVIANTFTVLIAQRTRALALLRCVGASTGQIRRSVFTEAAALGVIASLAGLGLGTALVAVGVQILAGYNLGIPLDTGIHLTPGIVAITVLVGTLVTLLAASVPARLATRVAPLAAMRPVEGTPERRAGVLRAVLAGVLGAFGVLLLAGAVALVQVLGEESDVILMALALGVLGGFLSLIAILVGAVFVVPPVIRLLGRAFGRGASARIATANAVRNPRRTAATASALVIGVALVTMMSTGAMTARETLIRTVGERFAVDLSLNVGTDSADLAPADVQVLRDHPDITHVVLLDEAIVELPLAEQGWTTTITVASVAEGDLDSVLRDGSITPAIEPGALILPSDLSHWYDLEHGQDVTLIGAGGTEHQVRLHIAQMSGTTALVHPELLEELGLQVRTSAAWARIADGANELSVVREVQASLTETPREPGVPVPWLSGGAAERAGYELVITTLLAIVLGLLGVSVVIALVGVANTLSLSVIERRRESGMLRAVGLSRRQLRGMLAIEGVLIALAGAVLGMVAGLAYGWAGSIVILGGFGDVALAVPWRDLAIVAGIALAAGTLASVLPAHSAARTSPVAALATE